MPLDPMQTLTDADVVVVGELFREILDEMAPELIAKGVALGLQKHRDGEAGGAAMAAVRPINFAAGRQSARERAAAAGLPDPWPAVGR